MPSAAVWTPGRPFIASASFTRPSDTTAYASGDLVANSGTAGSVTPLSFTVAEHGGGPVMLHSARILKSGTSITNTTFALLLYQSSPTVANGDNGALSSTMSGYFGLIDLVAGVAFSDGAGGDDAAPNVTLPMIVQPENQSRVIYGLLRAGAAYTPGNAEVFTIYLHGRSY